MPTTKRKPRTRAKHKAVKARRPAKPGGLGAGAGAGSGGGGHDPDYPERLREHRQRQASVGALLDAAFGAFADSSPALWERRAYHMIVGLIYERLTGGELDIPTEELVALSKMLADNRRAAASRQAAAARVLKKKPNRPRSHDLPDNFGEIVQRVYGANFQGRK